jgi:N-methylhydantoinase A
MEAEGRRRLGADFAGRIRVSRAVDMRYGEQTFEITVPLEDVNVEAPDLMERVVERFHRRHEELYTYSAPGQNVILVNARVAVVGLLPSLPAEQAGGGTGGEAQPRSRRAYIGRWLEVPVYDLESVRQGLEVKGPAIFESSTTTVVLRENERTTVTPLGWLDIGLR